MNRLRLIVRLIRWWLEEPDFELGYLEHRRWLLRRPTKL